jgi:hypothetical protein
MLSISNFVYESNSSVTDEIIEDIHECYSKEGDTNVMMYHLNLADIKRFLYKEIQSHLHLYMNQLNMNQENQNENLFSVVLNVCKSNMSDIVIHKRENSNTTNTAVYDPVVSKACSKRRNPQTCIIQYVWFLHDYDGLFSFSLGGQNHHVYPVKGKLIMYPISWCFPVTELISTDESNILTLRGTFSM